MKLRCATNGAPEAVVSYVATKAQRVATYDPGALQRVKQWLVVGLWGPTDWSRCRWGEGSVTCGRASRGISDPDYYVFNMATRLPQAAEPPHAPRNTSRASATTTALHPADQHPRPRVSNYLPAAGGHRPPSPASSPAAATYGARAGRALLADREPRLSPTRSPPPSTSAL